MAKPSILSTIMRIESGGRNVPQKIDDINMRRGDPAQGYFQITGGTWNDFGGGATGKKSAIEAPYAEQLKIAQNIPVERWGPNTQTALRSAGYEPKPGETLGQMLARYSEDPASTRPEDVGGTSDGSTVVAAAPTSSLPNLPTGLLTASAAPAVDPAIAAEKEAEATNQGLIKSGLGLLAKGEAKAPEFAPLQTAMTGWKSAGEVPDLTETFATPDFNEILARQRLMRRV